MNQNENTVLGGQADVDIAFLRFGTINAWISKQEGIIEDCLTFIEGHFVPFEVLSGFDFIPFKTKSSAGGGRPFPPIRCSAGLSGLLSIPAMKFFGNLLKLLIKRP